MPMTEQDPGPSDEQHGQTEAPKADCAPATSSTAKAAEESTAAPVDEAASSGEADDSVSDSGEEGGDESRPQEAGAGSGPVEGETKKQKRKRERREKRCSKWKQDRKSRRGPRKRRHVGGPQEAAESGQNPSGGKAEANGEQENLSHEEIKRRRVERKEAELADFKKRCEEGATVVLDCEWESDMVEKELKGLVQQVMYIYGSNRSAARPLRLVLSGVAPGSYTLEKLSKMAGFPDKWPGVEVIAEPYIERFASESDKRRLVYLTADTDNVIDSFDQNGVYIIGGIVDHNRLKGCTKTKADDQGVQCGRLPLQEHIEMGTYSRVLTCNHVFGIILEHQRSRDWRCAFEKCIPGRKQWIEPSTTDAK